MFVFVQRSMFFYFSQRFSLIRLKKPPNLKKLQTKQNKTKSEKAKTKGRTFSPQQRQHLPSCRTGRTHTGVPIDLDPPDSQKRPLEATPEVGSTKRTNMGGGYRFYLPHWPHPLLPASASLPPVALPQDQCLKYKTGGTFTCNSKC